MREYTVIIKLSNKKVTQRVYVGESVKDVTQMATENYSQIKAKVLAVF